MRITLLAVLLFTILIVALLAAVGPAVMQLAFSDRFEYDRFGLIAVAIGMGFYLAASTLTQALVALRRVWLVAACWLSSSALLIVWYVLGGPDAFRRVEIGFAAGAAGLALLLWLSYSAARSANTR